MTTNATSWLSTHVLDTERGEPAAGLAVTLSQHGAGDSWVVVGEAVTDADGRVGALGEGPLVEGSFRLRFDVDTYYRARQRPAPFLEAVTVQFRVVESQRHYHVPLLLSPFGCTAYRGS